MVRRRKHRLLNATNINPSTLYTFEICHIQALYQFFSVFQFNFLVYDLSNCSLGTIMTCFTFKICETQVLYQSVLFSLFRFKYLGDLLFPTIIDPPDPRDWE